MSSAEVLIRIAGPVRRCLWRLHSTIAPASPRSATFDLVAQFSPSTGSGLLPRTSRFRQPVRRRALFLRRRLCWRSVGRDPSADSPVGFPAAMGAGRRERNRAHARRLRDLHGGIRLSFRMEYFDRDDAGFWDRGRRLPRYLGRRRFARLIRPSVLALGVHAAGWIWRRDTAIAHSANSLINSEDTRAFVQRHLATGSPRTGVRTRSRGAHFWDPTARFAIVGSFSRSSRTESGLIDSRIGRISGGALSRSNARRPSLWTRGSTIVRTLRLMSPERFQLTQCGVPSLAIWQ